MKKKKYFIITLIILLIILMIFKLIINNNKSIIGKWKAIDTKDEYYYIFNKDKTCSYEMTVAKLNCTYEIKDTKLIILYKDEKGKDNKFKKQK